MAKVKSALEKLKSALAAKGLNLDEIKDTVAELEAADVDLANAAEAVENNQKWVQWYQQVAPEVQAAMSERDALKAQLQQLEAAGVKLTPAQQRVVNEPGPGADGKYVSPDELRKFQNDIASASSAVMKQMVGISFRHFKKFQAEPDWDKIETMMQEKNAYGQPKYRDPEEAYSAWAKPMYDKANEDEIQRKIDDGIKQGVQDRISKMGLPTRKRRGDEVELEELAKAAKATKEDKGPSDSELRDLFIADLNSDVTH